MNRLKPISRCVIVGLLAFGLCAVGTCPGTRQVRGDDGAATQVAAKRLLCCCGTSDGCCCGKACCLAPTSKHSTPSVPAPPRGSQRDLAIARDLAPLAGGASNAGGECLGRAGLASWPAFLSLQSQHVRIQT